MSTRGYAIVLGSMLSRAEPTWHRPDYKTGTRAGKRWQRVSTLCGLWVASVNRAGTRQRAHSVLRQDHAEKIGRQCSRCAARHEEARSG